MTASASLLMRHEARLGWRDLVWMLTAGRSRKMSRAIIGFSVFIIFMHWLSYAVLTHVGFSPHSLIDRQTLLNVTISLLLSWALMLSQAMESVTRGFYTRGDLDLILASPINPKRIFALRLGVNAVLVSFMSVILLGPVVNVLAIMDDIRWLAGYGVALAMGLTATALAVLITITLFYVAGPKRTRFLAQVLAAIIGALFAISIQVVGIMGSGDLGRGAILHSTLLLAHVPEQDSWLMLPARATMGNLPALMLLFAAAIAVYITITTPLLGKFAHFATLAAGASQAKVQQHKARQSFVTMTPMQAMRRKEWYLLWRDPWLVSQSLMQLLYLLPPALLLWMDVGIDGKGVFIAIPVLVMAAGQLAGGLTWITISGEDAPDLITTCPLTSRQTTLAKLQTVMQVIVIIFSPFLAVIALGVPWFALTAIICAMAACVSSATIQLWFRTQAKRSSFRRRQTASRVATFSEAFCCVCWAAMAALMAMKTWFALVMMVFGLLVLLTARFLRPRNTKNYLLH